MHLGETDASNYTDALAACANAFSSNAQDLEFSSWGTSSNTNPMFQYLDQRAGYIGGIGQNLVDMMNGGTVAPGDDDPRLAIYANALTAEQVALPINGVTYNEGDFVGVTAGGLYHASEIGDYFTGAQSAVSLISYVEVKFIEAEASFRNSDLVNAATAYNAAVNASLDKYDVSDAAWELANTSETAATITLTKIFDAKYIALFLNMETFSDWRRRENRLDVDAGTGVFLTPAIGGTTPSGDIPRRFIYPTAARTYGDPVTFPAGKILTDRVWWDIAP